jgi:hypothetical protein
VWQFAAAAATKAAAAATKAAAAATKAAAAAAATKAAAAATKAATAATTATTATKAPQKRSKRILFFRLKEINLIKIVRFSTFIPFSVKGQKVNQAPEPLCMRLQIYKVMDILHQ